MAIKVFVWIEPESRELWGRFEGFYQLYDDFGDVNADVEAMVELQQIENMFGDGPGLPGDNWEMPQDIQTVEDAQKAAEAIGQIVLDAYYRQLKGANDG